MAKISNRKIIALLSVATLLGSSAAVLAGPVYEGPRTVIITQPSKKAVATVNSQVRAHNAPADVSLTNAAALSAFRVKFDNGDHALRSINVAKQTDQTAGLWMSDANGDDPISATGTWWVVPGATGGEVSTRISSGEEINLTVPAGPANHRLVLGGFSINIGGTTSNFETGEVQIGRIALNLTDPYPEPTNGAASRISGTVYTSDGNRPIYLTVQYVWVPNNYVNRLVTVRNETAANRMRNEANGTTRGGQVRNLSQAVGELPETDRYLIRSFDLSYGNGTHNMLGLGIHLKGTPGATEEIVTWQDNNRDDPIQYSVTYLQMK